ncbi:MAG: hypothetical protein FJ028_07260 [Chloroflexi bacterium]|nr:hypothetical protein [Chloroflexota bacterium]
MVLKGANFMADTTQFLFALLSGVAFPVTYLPFAGQVVAVLLPTTWPPRSCASTPSARAPSSTMGSSTSR